MSGANIRPDTPQYLGETLAAIDRRLRSLEARDAAGSGTAASAGASVTTSSTVFVSIGTSSATVIPGPSGIVLVLISGRTNPGGGPATDTGTLAVQVTVNSTPPVSQPVTDNESLQFSGSNLNAATRAVLLQGLQPGVSVTLTLMGRTNDAAFPMNFQYASLIGLPL